MRFIHNKQINHFNDYVIMVRLILINQFFKYIGRITSYYKFIEIDNLYSISKTGRKPSTKLIYAKSNQSLMAYVNYCDIMANLARQISEHSGCSITSFQLEGFLFGKNLKSKKNKDDSNPRYWIQKNFAEKYLV
jgi:hypothetical protein